jgi:hypothetical protein
MYVGVIEANIPEKKVGSQPVFNGAKLRVSAEANPGTTIKHRKIKKKPSSATGGRRFQK